jgi:hypothetical protein
MKLSTIALALCFALGPFVAHANDNAVRHHRALHHEHAAIPTSAAALVRAVKVDDNSDGLSRNSDD